MLLYNYVLNYTKCAILLEIKDVIKICFYHQYHTTYTAVFVLIVANCSELAIRGGYEPIMRFVHA